VTSFDVVTEVGAGDKEKCPGVRSVGGESA